MPTHSQARSTHRMVAAILAVAVALWLVSYYVTFEILRHRFTAIAEEGAITLRNVSGSPTIAQSNDCNVVLMDPAGVGLVIGYTLPTHALSCMYLAQYVLREFATNPGIRPGDMFMSNHPYICTPHQTCVATVAPVFYGEELVAWAGAGIHVADVGGTAARAA